MTPGAPVLPKRNNRPVLATQNVCADESFDTVSVAVAAGKSLWNVHNARPHSSLTVEAFWQKSRNVASTANF